MSLVVRLGESLQTMFGIDLHDDVLPQMSQVPESVRDRS